MTEKSPSFLTGYAIVGLGQSGWAAAEILSRQKLPLVVWDDDALMRDKARAHGFQICDFWQNSPPFRLSTLILSPGIPDTFPKPHPAAVWAKEKALEIICDVEVFLRLHPQAKAIGITGTNGKSTTTALLGFVFDKAKAKAAVGGNIGEPVFHLPDLPREGTYLLELSSYQIERIDPGKFDGGILLNITPDHLDRHGGFEGYIAAKKRLLDLIKPGGCLVIGVDDEPCRKIYDQAKTSSHLQHVVPISVERKLDRGVFVVDGKLYDTYFVNGDHPLCDLKTLALLQGSHNWQNCAAAYGLSRWAKLELETILTGLVRFPGLIHRQQKVTQLGSVTYINDSKATNCEATGKALACYDRVYWIAGGRPKDKDFSALTPYFPKIAHGFLIGEAAPLIAASLDGKVPYSFSGTLDRAISEAHIRAQRDPNPSVILLSPACASFDQFQNFEQRGNHFITHVQNLTSVAETNAV